MCIYIYACVFYIYVHIHMYMYMWLHRFLQGDSTILERSNDIKIKMFHGGKPQWTPTTVQRDVLEG